MNVISCVFFVATVNRTEEFIFLLPEKFEIEDEKNRRNMQYEHYLRQADEDKTIELRGTIIAFFLSTCIYIVITKITGFVICCLEDFVTQIYGHSSYNFYFFTMIFYIVVVVYSYYYYNRVYPLIFINEIGKYYFGNSNTCSFTAEKCAYVNLLHEHELPYNLAAIMEVFSEPD